MSRLQFFKILLIFGAHQCLNGLTGLFFYSLTHEGIIPAGGIILGLIILLNGAMFVWLVTAIIKAKNGEYEEKNLIKDEDTLNSELPEGWDDDIEYVKPSPMVIEKQSSGNRLRDEIWITPSGDDHVPNW